MTDQSKRTKVYTGKVTATGGGLKTESGKKLDAEKLKAQGRKAEDKSHG